MSKRGLISLAVSICIFSLLLCSCSDNTPEKIDNSGTETVADTPENSSDALFSKTDDKSDSAGESDATCDESDAKTDNELCKKITDCVTENFSGFSGKYCWGVNVYGRGCVNSGQSGKMKSASVIKLYIMEYAYDLIGKNEITPDTKIGGKSLLSLVESMIIYSDNDSTNILINHFGMGKINEYISSKGYTDTVLARKMLDTAAAARGEENYTSVSDVMKFLDSLYENKDAFPQKDMLDIMKRQSVSTKIRHSIPSGVEIANKTGELSDTDNDVGIIFTQNGDFAFVCLTMGASPEPARSTIANTAKNLYEIVMEEQ